MEVELVEKCRAGVRKSTTWIRPANGVFATAIEGASLKAPYNAHAGRARSLTNDRRRETPQLGEPVQFNAFQEDDHHRSTLRDTDTSSCALHRLALLDSAVIDPVTYPTAEMQGRSA